MRNENSCPYYGRDEDWCDVGFGYISPHDVEVIVRHCVSRYGDCPRFSEIKARRGAGRVEDAERGGRPATPGTRPGTVSPLPAIPASVDRATLTDIHHELRTPLTSIRSFTEILMQYPVENLDSKRQFLRLIYEESQRLTRAVDALFGTPDLAAGSPCRSSKEGNACSLSHPGTH